MKIFDERLEVSNPGGLPAGLTVEDLKNPHESKPRNKLVADAFFLIKYIEQFGTGIGRMLEECRQVGVPEPQFECRPESFRIVFQKPVLLEARLAGLELTVSERWRGGCQPFPMAGAGWCVNLHCVALAQKGLAQNHQHRRTTISHPGSD